MLGRKHKNCYTFVFLVRCEPSYIVNTNDFKYAKLCRITVMWNEKPLETGVIVVVVWVPIFVHFFKNHLEKFFYMQLHIIKNPGVTLQIRYFIWIGKKIKMKDS